MGPVIRTYSRSTRASRYWRGDAELATGGANIVESIAPTLRIVKSPEKLFAQLEHAEQVPLLVKHGKRALQPLPKTARTLFPKISAKAKTEARRKKPWSSARSW